MCFNYLGRFDSTLDADAPWRLLPELPGANQDDRQPRPYRLEITALVVDGRLHVRWTHVPALHAPEEITRLAERFQAELVALAEPGVPDALGPLEATYPLSPLQKGMFFHTRYARDSGVYVVQLTFRLDGPVSPTAFRAAWTRLTERHPVLRTSFHQDGNEDPIQRVHRGVSLPWREEDWRGLGDTERESRLSVFLREERARAFDLAQAPLFRLVLVRLGDDAWQFVWTHHHLLLDGWSLPVILRELFTCYEAEASGEPAVLAPVRPFGDYLDWLDDRDSGDAERFWRGVLAGFSAPTPLPLGSGALSDGAGCAELVLPVAVTEALGVLSRRHGVTLGT
ncbi:condensation domain-containing protein, partial [Amycolatopsis rhizosphaerae]|uniref:condensation domain-containing protein n=1 Tax=Amycolatopsis rhizosphaerae TaxID=2053003 RepID=UPI001FE588A2